MLEINDSVFGKMKYDHRWIKEEKILLFDQDYNVKICAKAFNEKPISDFQRDSYKKMKKELDAILIKCVSMISDYLKNIYGATLANTSEVIEAVKLTHIIFMQNGNTIFLFDTEYDVENGIGIQIYPEMEIGPQDTFL